MDHTIILLQNHYVPKFWFSCRIYPDYLFVLLYLNIHFKMTELVWPLGVIPIHYQLL